jgi:hypothetical protein
MIISRRMRRAEEIKNAYKILVGDPEGKRSLGRLSGIDGG